MSSSIQDLCRAIAQNTSYDAFAPALNAQHISLNSIIAPNDAIKFFGIYRAGDALGVRPVNCPDLVTEWLGVTGLRADDPVDLDRVGVLPLGEALAEHLDITRVTTDLIRFAVDRGAPLKALLRADNKGELAKWAWGRQAVDLIAEHAVRAGAQDWVDVLKRLQPRLYSISSTPLTNPDRVSLTVSVVRFGNPHGRTRKGVCSTHLADAAPNC
jgi:sulfite reductase alpha subunit-like flavoprotein